MSTYATLLLSTEDAVATLTLNRPDKLNALNAELLNELYAAVHALESDASVRAVVVTGAGEKAFAAGADIAAMSEMTTTRAKTFADLGHAIGAAIEASRMPYVAAVNGFALGGGCELALACDFIYAADKAKFGQPEVNLGVIPGFGGTQRLARRVGIGRARELCMTGDMVGAEEALTDRGFVNKVTSREEVVGAAREAAKKIAEQGPLAIAQCKRVMLRGADLPLTTRRNELRGAVAFSALFGSQDQREGMRRRSSRSAPRNSKGVEPLAQLAAAVRSAFDQDVHRCIAIVAIFAQALEEDRLDRRGEVARRGGGAQRQRRGGSSRPLRTSAARCRREMGAGP